LILELKRLFFKFWVYYIIIFGSLFYRLVCKKIDDESYLIELFEKWYE